MNLAGAALTAGLVALLVALAGLLAALGSALAERSHQRAVTAWRVETIVDGGELVVLLVREWDGMLAGRLLIERVPLDSPTRERDYAAALDRARERACVLRGHPDPELDARLDEWCEEHYRAPA